MAVRDRSERLSALLAERILVLDGATGTYIQGRGLEARDFGGPAYEGCNEHLVLTRPDVVREMHEGYLAAGADLIETDSFGATRIVLAEYELAHRVREINATAARLAREACARFETADRPRFAAGSMGPGTKTISVTRNIGFDDVRAAYAEQTAGLVEGGADVLFLETQQDTLNVKAALLGVEAGLRAAGRTVPVVLSVSIETMGTMLAGQSVEALYVSVAHRDLLALGLNCATGPDFMTDHLRTLAQLSRFPLSCFPNAGLPDEEGRYNETPESLVGKLERFCAEGWVNMIGGCCGTTAEHIRLIAEMARRHRPRTAAAPKRSVVSGIEVLPLGDDSRPVIVGERTNVIGSRKFKELIVAGDLDQAAEVGRRQVRGGAQILDVCLANPDRDELADVTAFLDVLTRKVKVPLMIDSTDHRVFEEALKRCQGKAMLNSINLEDGEERFARVAPLVRAYGAAVIVGCIDEDRARGMAVTRERKLAIAQRSHRLLTERYGIAEEDIVFDPLVFPVGTGDQAYAGAGAETVEGVRLIKEALPRTKTILGISNVSFGLPATGREILNSVFLHHCVRAGLDLAIVNAEKLERYPSIPEEDRRLAEDLVFWRGPDPVAAFTAHFRGRGAAERRPAARAALPLDARIARAIVEGSTDGLVEDLGAKLREARPLEIINGPLMAGMDEVGRLFNDNQLIVAEVLQSAEAMKTAVAYLEPFLEKTESATKGTVVLATVKGDVHDIGKNLVEIILGNNGFRVIDLGIRVPPEDLIRAHREHRPDLIGLSGLLVKSAQQMAVTAEDLRQAGIRCPVLVGGAALSARFTAARIAPAYDGLVCYARDAMAGLELANKLAQTGTREALAAQVRAEQERLRAAPARAAAAASPPTAAASIRHDRPIPTPPDLRRHVIERLPLEDVLPYVNPAMLYGKHLGLRGNLEALLAAGDEKALALRRRVEAVENEVLAAGAMAPRAVYQFFPVQADGDAILVYGPGHRLVETFAFPRQSAGESLCLADFVAPRTAGLTDYVALFAVTCGEGVRELAARAKSEGRLLDSHVIQALALEAAEGLAELIHRRLREMWGFPDPPAMTMPERFKARYRGVRVSFGYPACPRLEDQEKLFRLLDVEAAIGVRLTEGHMMDPEASVSALVFHHPEARYFAVSREDVERFERERAAG